MYTADEVGALRLRLEAEGKSKAEIVKALAWACLGWPYVFGSWGEMCTPHERRKRAGLSPDHKKAIYDVCPVLHGNQTSCAGCKWVGRRCFDCRGFTHWLLEQAGLDLYGQGASTQYDTAGNWAARGEIKDMPKGLVCCVFKRRDGKMSHTGMHVGGGEIVHCSTVVKTGNLSDRPKWTHYAIPAGLYTNEELRKAGVNMSESRNIPIIRKGAKGLYVEVLQDMLGNHGYVLAADGIFGIATEDAVKAFQKANGLTVDGIVGPKTWAALGMDFNESEHEPEEPGTVPEEPETGADDPDEEEPHPPDMMSVSRADLEVWADVLDEMAKDIREVLGQG